MEETDKQRRDRELGELLSELRVALPGAQVLFAFLLTIAFTPRFSDLGATDRDIYVAAVLLSASAIGLLIAPSAHHRLRFRQQAKEGILRLANALTLLGLLLLSLAVGAVLYLVIKAATGATTAAWCAGLVCGATLLLWFALPFALDRRGDEVAD